MGRRFRGGFPEDEPVDELTCALEDVQESRIVKLFPQSINQSSVCRQRFHFPTQKPFFHSIRNLPLLSSSPIIH
ncbi:hypothetical protein L6452_12709 [Arctium lappa]|uniref:Uncharacterized protein n=1 Tax=Arctium lappa TaxID=4217 RepID=A0ACB9DRC3_ARCLA|nr:hypothetical protein L6452_12709 [Arctium lappa]